MVQESFLDPFRGGGAGEDVDAVAVLSYRRRLVVSASPGKGKPEAMQAAGRAQAVGAASTASRRRRTYVPVPCSNTATGRSLMSG
ncbi:hypothetical protein ACWGIV_35485 [Streptomyces sp. NPDC054844]